MDASSNSWRDLFGGWPSDLPRRGVLITAFGEQVSFSGFLTSPTLLLVERQTPDAIGARMVVLGYGMISALKLTEVVESKKFQPLGFEGSLSKR